MIGLLLMGAMWAQVQPPDEMRLLIERIQKDLDQVDESLAKAVEVDELSDEIEKAKDGHLRAIRDLDELIKNVKYRRSSQSQGGGGGMGGGGAPMPQEDQPQPSDGSSAPEPSPQQPTGGAEEQGGQPDSSQGRNEQGEPPPPAPTGDFVQPDTDGRWGLLPPKLQERLMNLHVDDVPERYRVQLEAYIRALRKIEQP